MCGEDLLRFLEKHFAIKLRYTHTLYLDCLTLNASSIICAEFYGVRSFDSSLMRCCSSDVISFLIPRLKAREYKFTIFASVSNFLITSKFYSRTDHYRIALPSYYRCSSIS